MWQVTKGKTTTVRAPPCGWAGVVWWSRHFLALHPDCLNNKYTYIGLCARGCVCLKIRCGEAHWWHIAILRQIKTGSALCSQSPLVHIIKIRPNIPAVLVPLGCWNIDLLWSTAPLTVMLGVGAGVCQLQTVSTNIWKVNMILKVLEQYLTYMFEMTLIVFL